MSRITKRDQLLLALKDAINEAKITDGAEVALADVVQPKDSVGDGERMKLLVCGVDMTWLVEGPVIAADNKYRFFTGRYGMKRAYLERRDGTFNLNRAAYELVTLARKSLKDKNEEARILKENSVIDDMLRRTSLVERFATLGFQLRMNATAVAGTVHFELTRRQHLPLQQAEEVLDLTA